MKEELSIDQKLQIAKIASDLECAGMKAKESFGAISRNSMASDHEAMFHHLYGEITKTIIYGPENS